MLLAGGFWAHGVAGAAAIGPLLGGLAVLSFGGLTARLAGPQWAPAGAIVLGLTLPEQYTARSSLAEPALQVLLFGGLCLLIDALTAATPSPPCPLAAARRLAATGLGPGLGRVAHARAHPGRPGRTGPGPGRPGQPGLADLPAPAHPVGRPAGGGPAARRDPVLSRGRPSASATAWPTATCSPGRSWTRSRTPWSSSASRRLAGRADHGRRAAAAGIRAPGLGAPDRGPPGPVRWLPALAALIAVAALVGFAVRPYVQTVRGAPSLHVYHYIAALQRLQGLPVDPTRTYAEEHACTGSSGTSACPPCCSAAFGMALLARQCPERPADLAGPVRRLAQLGAAAGHHLHRLGRHPVAARHRARPAVGQPPARRHRAARADRLRAVGRRLADRPRPRARRPRRTAARGRAVLRRRAGRADRRDRPSGRA